MHRATTCGKMQQKWHDNTRHISSSRQYKDTVEQLKQANENTEDSANDKPNEKQTANANAEIEEFATYIGIQKQLTSKSTFFERSFHQILIAIQQIIS